ncbi:hypothetical protein [Brevibacillus daliensis]|uniref:hypothetical protein n=1 Tax=Brevibacillus daliensis TaxID=2892995 RepID=UPI001E43528A|nr:hypothetical protein [Brevibacillus daliensis]
MKKTDWLIAVFFIAIGVMCLTISATFYQRGSSINSSSFMGTFCIWILMIGLVIYLIYFAFQIKQNRRKKK